MVFSKVHDQVKNFSLRNRRNISKFSKTENTYISASLWLQNAIPWCLGFCEQKVFGREHVLMRLSQLCQDSLWPCQVFRVRGLASRLCWASLSKSCPLLFMILHCFVIFPCSQRRAVKDEIYREPVIMPLVLYTSLRLLDKPVREVLLFGFAEEVTGREHWICPSGPESVRSGKPGFRLRSDAYDVSTAFLLWMRLRQVERLRVYIEHLWLWCYTYSYVMDFITTFSFSEK